MGMTYYDHALITTERTLSPDAFEHAWMLRERAFGNLRDSKRMTVLFGILGAAFLALKIPELAQFRWESAIAGLLEFLLCVACIIYQQIVLPQRMMSMAHDLYRTNKLLQQTERITLTRDGFEIQNRCETVRGFWSETAFCAEDEAFMIFGGGLDREMVIVAKENWTEEEKTRVSEKMKETFAGRYKYVNTPAAEI